jgi:glycosyltransferase involved in cell wall biosynthesis
MLACELCWQGYEVVLVTLGPEPRSDQLRLVCDTPGLRVEITDLALEWTDPEGGDVLRAWERLSAIARRFEPDLIHLNSYREACADWNAPVIVAAHSCVRSWWRACRRADPDEARWQRYMVNVKAGLKAADAWVAPSLAFGAEIERLYFPPTAGRVIWNGVSAGEGICTKEPFVLASGRLWDEAKNVSVLSDVAPFISWPVRVAGPLKSGPAGAGQTVNGVDALGEMARPDLLALARRASICVAPALYEPFGLSVLEAAASGCALVLSDIATFRELWDGAALFVDPRDPASIRAALAHLITDDAERARMQRIAIARAERYSLARMVSGYRKLYTDAIDHTSATIVPFPMASIEANA